MVAAKEWGGFSLELDSTEDIWRERTLAFFIYKLEISSKMYKKRQERFAKAI
jgi:hypothetical protein